VASLKSSDEVTNRWRFSSTPPYVLILWSLIKHSDFLSLGLNGVKKFYNSRDSEYDHIRPILTHLLTYLLHGAGHYLKS
jgi:VanZ family protein